MPDRDASDGPVIVAALDQPYLAPLDAWYGVAVDARGWLYVVDAGNHRLCTVAPDGTITTLAGSGIAGYIDGPGHVAQFNDPGGVAVDAGGIVYVADTANHCIRRVMPDGTVSTFAGSDWGDEIVGPAIWAEFHNPRGVAIDRHGVLYIADSGNHRIAMLMPDGAHATLAGPDQPGSGRTDAADNVAAFNEPSGIAVDTRGAVYVADTRNHCIRAIAPDGTVTTVAGSGVRGYADGAAVAAQFAGPLGIAVDTHGSVYVADAGNRRVRRIESGGSVSTLRNGEKFSFFYQPEAVAVDAQGTLYIADSHKHVIRALAHAGTSAPAAGSRTPTQVTVAAVYDCMVDDGESTPHVRGGWYFSSFPATAPPFQLVLEWELSAADLNAQHTEQFALTDGEGTVLQTSGEQTRFYPGPEDTVRSQWQVRNATFPSIGSYFIEVFWDGEAVHQVPLAVRQYGPDWLMEARADRRQQRTTDAE